MIKICSLKEAMLQVTFVATILLMASCTNTQQQEDSKDVAEERNDAKFENNRQEKDAQFLVNAAEINLEEIQLGQLAQQIGSTSEVKELGKMMQDAHNKSLKELTSLAQSKMITLPASLTDKAMNDYDALNKKSGNDFDKAYADLMVQRHEDAIKIFDNASTDCKDNEIRNWAQASLPELRKHYDHAMDCQNNVKISSNQ